MNAAEITVSLCESFAEIGIDISEADLNRFERALYERGLNVAPLDKVWNDAQHY